MLAALVTALRGELAMATILQVPAESPVVEFCFQATSGHQK